MAEVTYRDAIRDALREEMQRDERVFIMGEEVGVWGGSYAVTQGMLREFGEKRIKDTPIADDDPVLYIEHSLLYPIKGEVPDGDYTVPLGVSDVKNEGNNLTLIAYS